MLLKFQLPDLKKNISSDKLKKGNLLILINPGFKDYILLRITKSYKDYCNQIDLSDSSYFICEGTIFNEELCTNSELLNFLNKCCYLRFFAIESVAFFYPCYYLLKRIINMEKLYDISGNCILPFKNILVDADYHSNIEDIDIDKKNKIMSIIENNNKDTNKNNNFYNIPETIEFEKQYCYNYKKFRLYDYKSFKLAFSFLDNSQVRALYYALTNKIAILQGPPGTGKTKVGTILTDLLLNVFNNNKILIVGYTNHALDSFLSQILKFETNIVRLGGRCEDENIKPYRINVLRKEKSFKELGAINTRIKKYQHSIPLFALCNELNFKLNFTYMDNNYKELTEKIILGLKEVKTLIMESAFNTYFKKEENLHLENKDLITHDIVFLDIIYENIFEHLFKIDFKLSKIKSGEKENYSNIYDLFFEENNSKFCSDLLHVYNLLLPIIKLCHYDNHSIDSFNDLFSKIHKLINGYILGKSDFYKKEINLEDYIIKDLYQNNEESLLRKFIYEIMCKIVNNKFCNRTNDDSIIYSEYVTDNKDKDQDSSVILEESNEIEIDEKNKKPIHYESTLTSICEDYMHLYRNLILLDYDSRLLIPSIEYCEFSKFIETISIYENLETFKNNILDVDIRLHDKRDRKKRQKTNKITKDNENKTEVTNNFEKLVFALREESANEYEFKYLENTDNLENNIYKLLNKKDCVWYLNEEDRLKLKIYYKDLIKNEAQSKYIKDLIILNEYYERRENIRNMHDYELIKDKRIIAMTTSGFMRMAPLIEKLNIETIIVDEAAEVLESHITDLLTNHTKHIIMIGDHKQLRPKPNNREIEKNYNYDISLFERLIMNDYPYKSLAYQRRMKPQFSEYVKIIYNDDNYKYFDHESTFDKPTALGLEKDMFFYNHNYPEQTDRLTLSKYNENEAKIVYLLAKYIVDQNISTDNVVIISPYLNQVNLIQNYLSKEDFLIRVTTIDNYQGEESDYIILSLVRSNRNNEIGFLKIVNRICVAFSRARIGFYIFGNFDFLLSAEKKTISQYKNKDNIPLMIENLSVSLWTQILATAKINNLINNYFNLKCQTHSNFTKIFDFNDLLEIKDGGCRKKCLIRKECGHICLDNCHNSPHIKDLCLSKCKKILDCGHECSLLCKDICDCNYLITVDLNCGHKYTGFCSFISLKNNYDDLVCTELCARLSPCGHSCSKLCYEKCMIDPICEYSSSIKLLCGHESLICISQYNLRYIKCKIPCDIILECGHKCQGNCTSCFQGNIHLSCKKPCEISFLNRKCLNYCGSSCSFSFSDFKNKCEHRSLKYFDKNKRDKITNPSDNDSIFETLKILHTEPNKFNIYCDNLVSKKWNDTFKRRKKCYEVLNYDDPILENKSLRNNFEKIDSFCINIIKKGDKVNIFKAFGTNFIKEKKNHYIKLECNHYILGSTLSILSDKCIEKNEYPNCLICGMQCFSISSLSYRNVTKLFYNGYCYFVIKQIKEFFTQSSLITDLDFLWNDSKLSEEGNNDLEREDYYENVDFFDKILKSISHFNISKKDISELLSYYNDNKEKELLKGDSRHYIEIFIQKNGLLSFDISFTIIKDYFKLKKKLKLIENVIEDELLCFINSQIDSLDFYYFIRSSYGIHNLFMLKKFKLLEIKRKINSLNFLFDILLHLSENDIEVERKYESIIIEMKNSYFYMSGQRIKLIKDLKIDNLIFEEDMKESH